jgi:hypothetical protein
MASEGRRGSRRISKEGGGSVDTILGQHADLDSPPFPHRSPFPSSLERFTRRAPQTAHSPSLEHQRQGYRKDHVRLDRSQGCWSTICQLGLQEG